jgi:hypothetical protein
MTGRRLFLLLAMLEEIKPYFVMARYITIIGIKKIIGAI